MSLVGRRRETARVERALDDVRRTGTALVVRGEPGAGKTALLEHGARRARDRSMLVLRTIGVESEARMSFAGLHMLLRPVAGQIGRLAPRQRDVLNAIMGSPADTFDRYLVALATLNLIADLTERSAVLLLADDAHWLDFPTLDVLVFVARRLEADHVVAMFGVRDGYETALDSAELEELHLAPLDAADASSLLEDQGQALDSGRRRRILDEAAGNPLALIELPLAIRDVDDEDLRFGLPVTARLERAFAARAKQLDGRTQAVLAAAALNDGDSTVEALQAAAALTDEAPTVDDLEPAVTAGLVQLDGPQLRFRHPLVRSALAQAAPTTHRLRVHRALADALVDAPDRRVWHLAASVVGPDEAVARELEEAAGRAERHGGHAVAAVALERAAALATDPSARGGMLLRAIALAADLGRRQDVERLLREVDRLRLTPPLSLRRVWIREAIAETRGRGTVPQFVRLSTQAHEAGDVEVALDAALTAALKAYWFNAPSRERHAVAESVERLAIDDLDPRRLAALSLATPDTHGAMVIDRLAGVGIDAFDDPETLRILGIALVTIPEYEMAAGFLAAAVDGLREEGRLTVLARALGSQSLAALFGGDFALSEQAAEEGVRLTRETRQPRWEASCHIFLGHLHGQRGQPDEARERIAEGRRLLGPTPSSPGRQHVELAYAATSLAAGEPDEAYSRVARLFEPADALYYPLIGTPGLLDLADAAIAIGRAEEASATLARLRPMALRTGSPFVGRALEDAGAVLASNGDAEAGYRASLAEDGGGAWRQARLSLEFGAWLRRQRRPAEARVPLRAARDLFVALEVPPWAERARRELRASGERAKARTVATRDELTAQEMQIARMAAEGLSNRDIAQRLFLSPRTVGSHLYRIFPKLGITSRFELARALGDVEPAGR